MSPTEDITAHTGAGSKLKVFVSYSRKDAGFAGELVSGLELCGFEAYLDKEDIAAGEPWEARLGRLIRDADTVVFVLSPSSVASKHCEWEVAETVGLSKRLLPIVWHVVPDDAVPEQLRRLNYIVFTEGYSFTKSLGELVNALRTDLEWIRQHTRFAELAANWEEKGRSPSLLLLGGEIGDAKAWLIKRPKDAPQITMQQQAFIDASIRAAEEAQKRDAALQWRAKVGAISAAVIFAIGAVVAGFAWWQEKKAVDGLRSANLRLSRQIALRVAPSGDASYFVGPNWYQIASDYSGAIAIVQNIGTSARLRTTDTARVWKKPTDDFQGTGFIIRGSTLYPAWGDEAVFVTASFVISSEKNSRLHPENAQAIFPGLGEKSLPITFGESLWERPLTNLFDLSHKELGVTVLRIKGSLPFGAKPIEKVRHEEFDSLQEPLPNNATPNSIGKDRLQPRPLAIIGFGAGRPTLLGTPESATGFALFLNTLVGVEDRDPEGKPLHLAYTSVTQPGVAGAPVFDIETGELVAIHQSNNLSKKIAAGVSIARVIAAIKKDLGPSK
jgi:hypothetical protein